MQAFCLGEIRPYRNETYKIVSPSYLVKAKKDLVSTNSIKQFFLQENSFFSFFFFSISQKPTEIRKVMDNILLCNYMK